MKDQTGIDLEPDVQLLIGDPPRPHAFDLASKERDLVGECKAYTWTAGGNTPSARITALIEAATYLQRLPSATQTFIVMKRDVRPGKKETLAEYFARLNDSLLGGVSILELTEDGDLRLVRGRLATPRRDGSRSLPE